MFWVIFGVLASCCAALVWREWSTTKAVPTEAFTTFQRNYIGVWLCMMMADWLQAPKKPSICARACTLPSTTADFFC